MKRLQPGCVLLVSFSLSLLRATPSRYSVFQGPEPRHRNKNWCAHVVHRNVSCVVSGGAESVVQPELVPCPMEQPNCAQQVIYRTHFRPMYKVAYKTVTELEWRCCPGFQGHDCKELKDPPQRQAARGGLPSTAPASGPRPALPGPDQTWDQGVHPWERPAGQPGGQTGHGQLGGPGGSHTVKHLEEEVQRLSQMVLDMQASMTEMSSSLRLDMQEDASKILVTLLNDRKQPSSARGGQAHTLPRQGLSWFDQDTSNMDEVLIKINQVTDTLESKSDALDDLLGRVNRHDGQLTLLMEAAQSPPPTAPAAPAQDAELRSYVDERIDALREELMEGMEIKMADLKSSCEYKVMSVKEQCEGQESNYFSLAELMDSKETEIRKEIQELKAQLEEPKKGVSPGYTQVPEPVLARVENLELRLNLSEKNAEVQCLFLKERLREEREEGMADMRKAVEDRLSSVEDRLINSLSINYQSEAQAEDLDALKRELRGHENNIQAMEGRLSNFTQLCVIECRSNWTLVENIQQNLQSHRTAIDAIQDGLNSQSDSRGAMEQFLQDHLLNYTTGIKDSHGDLSSLRDRVVRMEGSMSDVSRSLGQHSQELQNLNATCGQVNTAQEATDLLELHKAQRQELRSRLDELGGAVRAEAHHCRENAEQVGREVASVEGRVASMEKVCGKLEPISGSLQRIKEGLNRHVAGLWTCVSQMNATVQDHHKDIVGLKGTFQNLQNHVSGISRDLQDLGASTPPANTGVQGSGLPQEGVPPLGRGSSGVSLEASGSSHRVMEVGEAGPPGTVTSSRLPLGADGSTVPVQGFAGAPALPSKPTVSVKLNMLPVQDALTVQSPRQHVASGEKASFSAGLNLLPFPGEVGIIRFNKVLANDGGHYDAHTGVFTAPLDGFYLLSAVLTAQRGQRVEAVLSVSNRSIQRLDTSGFPSGAPPGPRDACGASGSLSLVLNLRRGDRAALIMTAGRLAITSSSEVLSTFSGVLLYPTPAGR